MRITDIKSYQVWVGVRNLLIVKVETDAGIYGLGEAGLSGRELAVMGALRHYRETLIGQDPMQRSHLWQRLYRSQYFEGGRVLLAAQSAIDLALYDIAGKAWGVPVYQLLGGKHRDTVPCFATAAGQTPEALVASVKMLVDAGWTVVRTMVLKPDGLPEEVFEPRETFAVTAEALIQARAALGSALTLGIDYHHRLSLAEAASFCQRLPPGTLDFIEEPIRDETPEAYAALRQMTPIPFAVGEEFASKWQFLPYIERHLTDFARVDICNVGGFTEAIKVAGWAEAHYIDLMPHNPLGPVSTAACVQLGAAVPNFAWLEARVTQAENLYQSTSGEDAAETLFPGQPHLTGTGFPVTDQPGLGVELNEAAAQSHDWKFWEAPHWRRRDGSITNW